MNVLLIMILSLLIGFFKPLAASAEELESETTYEKVKFACENYSFETPDSEKIFDMKTWLKPIEMKIVADENKGEEDQNISLYAGFGHNRGALGAAGSWKFWKWTDKIHIYSDSYNPDKKTDKYPYYVVQVLSRNEAYVLKYESDDGDYKIVNCAAD